MANPQPENGTVRIANELWDEVIRRDFSKRQKDIIFFIWRLSYGCKGQKTAYIPKLVYFELCGIPTGNFHRELDRLEALGVLIRDREKKTFEINKNYDEWKVPLGGGWNEFKFDELLALNLDESRQINAKNRVKTTRKNALKQRDFEGSENEIALKQRDASRQNNANLEGNRVKITHSTPDEPNQDAGSQPPIDIIKDINTDSSSTKILMLNQGTAPAASRSKDFSFSKIYTIYEKHFTENGNVSEFEVQDLTDQFETYGGEWLLEAMREAVRHKIRTLAYINGVLNGYKARGGPHKDKNLQIVGGPADYQLADDDPIAQKLREVYQL
ncbi:putative prophage replication protein O [Paenibacillus mucilaginosus 3016]|uniref:Putative prophage replication protein O n=1 Tax=Paenibacillus mucilaginosus 3016 TaxID=1116391 RepID=H6NDW9_9BACL|nr:replication protein [Paenibacillus mucilaginosus]AFC32168.1 putative prophage replication protein O [Paenibacillus mucilaginosus 3016]WFA20665.1 replication protein [Paenibacillus mucilaginosus]